MVRCTIWGDFKADTVEKLHLSDELRKLLRQSDVNIVNFEAPVHSEGRCIRKSGPNLSQSEAAPSWLEENGFNVIALANNHSMDYGAMGLQKTITGFKTSKIVGAGNWKDAYAMTVIDVEGLKIGILSGTHCEFGTLTEKSTATGAAWCMSPMFDRQILMNSVDYLIVVNHAGLEYMDYPLPEWRETYKKWIDMGADAVIASHPHVPQGWEMYNGKPICYSLGNFCFQTKEKVNMHWNESLCCILELEKRGAAKVVMRPVFYDVGHQRIADNKEIEFQKHMEILNRNLENDEVYLEQVNKAVLKRLPQYYGLFSRSGFFYPSKSLGLFKGIVERFKKEHIYNCIKCESHRWAIIRAFCLRYGCEKRNVLPDE